MIHSSERARINIYIRFRDALGMPVAFVAAGQYNEYDIVELANRESCFEFTIGIDNLAVGDYTLRINTLIPGIQMIEEIDDCLKFTVERAPQRGATRVLKRSLGYG